MYPCALQWTKGILENQEAKKDHGLQKGQGSGTGEQKRGYQQLFLKGGDVKGRSTKTNEQQDSENKGGTISSAGALLVATTKHTQRSRAESCCVSKTRMTAEQLLSQAQRCVSVYTWRRNRLSTRTTEVYSDRSIFLEQAARSLIKSRYEWMSSLKSMKNAQTHFVEIRKWAVI